MGWFTATPSFMTFPMMLMVMMMMMVVTKVIFGFSSLFMMLLVMLVSLDMRSASVMSSILITTPIRTGWGWFMSSFMMFLLLFFLFFVFMTPFMWVVVATLPHLTLWSPETKGYIKHQRMIKQHTLKLMRILRVDTCSKDPLHLPTLNWSNWHPELHFGLDLSVGNFCTDT